METIRGLPCETSPSSNPPISEPREVSERKLSTASRSSRSIKLNGILTDTGFCGTSQTYKGEEAACKSNRSARAVDSVIENPPPVPSKMNLDQLTDDFTQNSPSFGYLFLVFFYRYQMRANDC